MVNVQSPTFQLVFGILGNVIGVGVNLAPVGTFYNIYKKKSTQGFSGLPYVFALSAALLWILYGIPLVTPSSTLLLTINSAASAIQISYLTIFLMYGASNRRRHVIKVMMACFSVLAIVSILVLTVTQDHAKRARVVGILCVVIGILSYASPLSVAKIVFLTKSVEFLPIVLCCFLFINSVIWSCYGIVTDDIYVMIPNGFGAAFGVVQLSLYLRYRNTTPLDPFDPENYKKAPLTESPSGGTIRGPKKKKNGENRKTKTGPNGVNGHIANGDGPHGGKDTPPIGPPKGDLPAMNGTGKHDHGHHVDVSLSQMTPHREDALSTLPGGFMGTPKNSPDTPNATPTRLSYTVIVINQEISS